MLTVFFRTLIIFLTVLLVIRLMGKRQIGEMQPFELVVTLIIADVACVPMSDITIPLSYGIVAIFCIFATHTLITFLNRKSLKLRKIFSGKPVIIINKDGIDFDEMVKQNMTISDLEESIRSQNCFSFEEIEYAILETNGNLSILTKTPDQPHPPLPITLISAGKINYNSLRLLKLNETALTNIMQKENIISLKDVLILSLTEDGNIYYQIKYKKKVTKTIDMMEIK